MRGGWGHRALALAVGLAVAACGGSPTGRVPLPRAPHPSLRGPALAEIQKRGVLRVALDLSAPPLAFREHGVPQGLDVDLAGLLAASLGTRVEILDTPTAVMEEGFPPGADLLIGLPPGRVPGIVTDPYYEVGQALLWPDRAPVRSVALLRGRRAAVVVGSPGERVAQAAGARLVATYLPEEAARLVERGDADVAVGDDYALASYATAHPHVGVTDLGGAVVPLSVVSRPDAPDVAAFVTRALRELRRSGGLDQLRRRWGLERKGREGNP